MSDADDLYALMGGTVEEPPKKVKQVQGKRSEGFGVALYCRICHKKSTTHDGLAKHAEVKNHPQTGDHDEPVGNGKIRHFREGRWSVSTPMTRGEVPAADGWYMTEEQRREHLGLHPR